MLKLENKGHKVGHISGASEFFLTYFLEDARGAINRRGQISGFSDISLEQR